MTEFQPESLSHSEPDLSAPDARLVAFIRNNVPPVPNAALDLEDRLMAVIATPTTPVSYRWPMRWTRTKGLMAIAGCSLLAYAGWQIHRILTPDNAAIELAEVEQRWLKDFNALTEPEETKPMAEWDWVVPNPTSHQRPPA